MTQPSENENWLIDEGHLILQKKADFGADTLLPIERLIRCWWIADYGMRNAGDLDTALDLDPDFLNEGFQQSTELALPLTAEAFAAGKEGLTEIFFRQFELICDELRTAQAPAN